MICTIIVLSANILFLLNISIKFISLMRAKNMFTKIFSYFKENKISLKLTSRKAAKIKFSKKKRKFKLDSIFKISQSSKK